MAVGNKLCPACRGNGKCAQCDGTGTNVHLNSDEPKCPECQGTGVCAQCQGSGRAYPAPDSLTLLHVDDIDK